MSEPWSTLWRRSVCHGCFSMLYNNGAETIKCRFLVLFNPNRIEHASQVIESRLGASVLWVLSWFQIAGRIASWIFCTWKAHGSVKVGTELLLFQSQKCCWQCLAKYAQTLINALAPTCLPWLFLHASKTIVGDTWVLFFVLFNPRSIPTYFTICTSYRILARRVRFVSAFLAPVAGRIASCIFATWKYRQV